MAQEVTGRARHGFHLRHQGLGRDVLFVGPGDGAKEGADLVEVGHLAQFAEDTEIQVGLQVENPLPPVLDLHIDLVVGKRFDLLDVPVHVRLGLARS